MTKRLRIGLDCDEVISKFMEPYINKFGPPKNDEAITYDCFHKLRFDKAFWMNVPLLNVPDFKPALFCSKRVHNKRWSKKYIALHLGFTDVPFYQLYYQHASKARMIKGRVDVFVDDSPSNVMDLNKRGIPCLLMDSPYNRHFMTPLRIYSLRYSEIEYTYTQIFGPCVQIIL